MKHIILCWLLCLTAGSLPAAEAVTFESGPNAATVIELFTSEGCSSCPPAEKWLSHFKTDPNLWKTIVPAAFHVDYWDHLGWSDRFGKEEFTERQRRYSEAWHSESVYTPGFAVDGKEWRGWFNGSSLPRRDARVGILRLAIRADNAVTATFTPEQPSSHGYVLEVALLGSDREIDVLRGENKGRKLHHDFVVFQFASASMTSCDAQWTGKVTFRNSAPAYSGSGSGPRIDQFSGAEIIRGMFATAPRTPDAMAGWVFPADGYQPIQATGGWLKPAP
jgi:hypothetical protein